MIAAPSTAGAADSRPAAPNPAAGAWFMPLVRALWGTAPGQRATAGIDMLAAAAARSVGPRPRVRIRQSGWVRHLGGPFPFDPGTLIEVEHAHDGLSFSDEPMPADHWPESWWHGLSASWRNNIVAYRIVGEARA